jgi:hypothetical protein
MDTPQRPLHGQLRLDRCHRCAGNVWWDDGWVCMHCGRRADEEGSPAAENVPGDASVDD